MKKLALVLAIAFPLCGHAEVKTYLCKPTPISAKIKHNVRVKIDDDKQIVKFGMTNLSYIPGGKNDNPLTNEYWNFASSDEGGIFFTASHGNVWENLIFFVDENNNLTEITGSYKQDINKDDNGVFTDLRCESKND